MDAVFQATYADLKLVKTRGVLQIIFEAPVEKDNEIMTVLGGMPRAAEERWFAIARLNIGDRAKHPLQPTTVDGSTLQQRDKVATAPGAEGKSLSARNPLTWQAVKSCNDPQFRLFLEQSPSTKQMIPRGCHVNTEKEAAMVVRSFCRVESRSHIVPLSAAADRWDNLYSQFIVWKNADRYVEAPGILKENQA